jgi:hypothetical protein
VHTGVWWGNLREDLGRPRRRCEGNIKVDLQGIGCGRGLDLSGSE